MTKQEKFQKAVKENDVETVKALLKDSEVYPVTIDDQVILHASVNGYVKIVELLLGDERVKPNVYDNQAIGLASEMGHVEVVRLLLDDDRINPAANYNYAIRYASIKGHVEVVNMLYYDYRVCHQQLVLDIMKYNNICNPEELIKRLITDKDLQLFHPDNESLDGKISSLDLIKKLYKADEKTKKSFIECGFDRSLFTFISLL